MSFCLHQPISSREMRIVTLLFHVAFLHTAVTPFQVNLRLTDEESGDNDQLQHTCLNVAAFLTMESDPGQIVSYCMSELPSKWNITEHVFDRKFTFKELEKRKVTSHQLYLWSAPLDVVERYQFYLNQPEASKPTAMAMDTFYNCTIPYFGSQCQYTFKDYHSSYASLNEFVHHYYFYNRYEPTLFTCYTHLECDRGPAPSCLDWTEICDGKLDCLDGGQDEQHCWELEIHQCAENEYHCSGGQCIPVAFVGDDQNVPDCLDVMDEHISTYHRKFDNNKVPIDPSFRYEDVSCTKINFHRRNALTSGCVARRQNLLEQAMFSIQAVSVPDECWAIFKCIVHMPIPWDPDCYVLCQNGFCNEFIPTACPKILFVPAVPVLAGHIYFAYEKEHSVYNGALARSPDYICSTDRLFHSTDGDKNILVINHRTCHRFSDFIGPTLSARRTWAQAFVHPTQQWLHRKTAWVYNDSALCNQSILHQCADSVKCISKARLFDSISDCQHDDDERIRIASDMCSASAKLNYFKCETTNECIVRHLVKDGSCDCTSFEKGFCDDEDFDVSYARNRISFQTICDGLTHLLPQLIFAQNETDETTCGLWECNNIYTRCDGLWNCRDGADEINCDPSPTLNCSLNSHICVSPETNKLMCLPKEKVSDGNIDCVGAADEPTLCRVNAYEPDEDTFYCNNDIHRACIPAAFICDGKPQCSQGDDENACEPSDLLSNNFYGGICNNGFEERGSDIARVLCQRFRRISPFWKVYFALGDLSVSDTSETNHESQQLVFVQSSNRTVQYYQPRCHRGLDVQVWLDKSNNVTRNTCLCPPSFYGDTCQYQNQRVSLTVRFSVTTDSVQIPIVAVISLIEDTDERRIHSHEQITYLAVQHCAKKFNVYLLYSSRPKNQSLKYALHIDFYESMSSSLTYRGSLLERLKFPFLPVHRLAFQLGIPRMQESLDRCSTQRCDHGRCLRYSSNLENATFCQCDHGWSGRYCTYRHTCRCSADSLCVGILPNNRSLCVCPLNKMGNRCLLTKTVCLTDSNATCLNGGRCVPVEEYAIFKEKSTCICPKGFAGDRCELSETKLIISFNRDIDVSPSMRVHYIEVHRNASPTRRTSFKTISLVEETVILRHSFPFHIVVVELFRYDYYLAVVQKTYNQSATIERTLHSSNHCVHLNTVLNATLMSSPLLRRIKYYHLPCRQSSPIVPCFHEEGMFCLCQEFDHRRIANCFEFDHQMKMNCASKSGCDNGGECFQDDDVCPKTSLCACPVCFYGKRCQLNTDGFTLSLDAILGYHIHPKVSFTRQPHAVLISSIIALIIIFSGTINGVLSLITFKDKKIRESGCGFYLLCSSLITLLAMATFALKFLILLLSQMEVIIDRSFLKIQCSSLDFLLRFCLTMDQWLTACVAAERALATLKGVHFDQSKTKLAAKWIVLGLAVVTVLTTVQEPMYRRLDDEDNDGEQRIWCISDYPSPIRVANLISTIFHLIIPFVSNLISAIIIITLSARRRATAQSRRTYTQLLSEQFQQHRNLLIGPTMLIAFAIPRLIISLASGCMRSTKDSWLFLLGYFVSLVPPLGTFVLFVLPSTLYKQAFRQAISSFGHKARRQS